MGNRGMQDTARCCYPPTAYTISKPERCACGNTFAATRPYYTHQVIEVPPIELEVRHFVLHQGWCTVCGTRNNVQVPPEHATGYGPRFSALMGELGTGNGRRMVQTFCASVFGVPLSLGAIQKVLDRVARAIEPHYTTIASQARQAPVNYIDETPWFLTYLQWLWVMVTTVWPST